MTGSIAPGLGFQALRGPLQQAAFARLSGGQDSMGLPQWRQALHNLPGAANNAGVPGTGTASAVDAAFSSMDANGDGQLTAGEFSTALDKMLDRARHRPRQGSALAAQLLGQQPGSGAVAAPDLLRRMLLGYGANSG